jgi:acetyltransferase-like isoleucine patch superfamily enzyme
MLFLRVAMSGRSGSVTRRSLHWQMRRIAGIRHALKSIVYYPLIFGSFGRRSRLIAPIILHEPRFMHAGSNALINYGARLEAHSTERHPVPELRIGDNVTIEHSVEIVCHNRVLIGKNTTVAGHCFISDTTHPFDGVPRSQQLTNRIEDDDLMVEIGPDTFIGFGCVILPGVHIGECCVIGAGSVVTKDIPPYSLAVGAPAQVLRSIERPEPA